MKQDCPHCKEQDCLPLFTMKNKNGRIGENCRHCSGSIYVDVSQGKILSILLPSQAIKV
jgi:hypothetical protein